MKLLTLTAEQGHYIAQFKLRTMYAEGTDFEDLSVPQTIRLR
jgi:hypothetical protein